MIGYTLGCICILNLIHSRHEQRKKWFSCWIIASLHAKVNKTVKVTEVKVSDYVMWYRRQVMFCWGKTDGKTHDVWREYKVDSMDSDGMLAWLAMQLFVCLLSLLIFTLLREAWQRTSLGVQTCSGSSHWLVLIRGGLAVSAGSCHCCLFVFSILTPLNWTVGVLTNGDWNHPQRTTSKQVYIPLFYLPSFHPYFWTMG